MVPLLCLKNGWDTCPSIRWLLTLLLSTFKFMGCLLFFSMKGRRKGSRTWWKAAYGLYPQVCGWTSIYSNKSGYSHGCSATCRFLPKKENKEKVWIQFKLERLSDFCYKCGALDHVTKSCRFADLATIISGNRIMEKVYGPWLRAKHGGNLLFINPSPDSDRQIIPQVEDGMQGELCAQIETNLFSDNQEGKILEEGKIDQTVVQQRLGTAADEGKGNGLQIFLNEIQKSVKLETLNLTLNRQACGGEKLLQEAVLKWICRENSNRDDLAL